MKVSDSGMSRLRSVSVARGKLRNWMQKRHALVIGLVLLFTPVTFWNFHLPGIHTDEAIHAAYLPGILSADAAKLPQPTRLPDNYLDWLDGQPRWPILGDVIYSTMLTPYIGLPFFRFLGFSHTSLRLFEAILGLSGILAGALLIRRLFGSRAAWLLGLMVIFDPSIVFWLRSQNFHYWYCVLFPILSVHCLMCLLHGARQRENLLALAAGIFLGLAAGAHWMGYFVSLPVTVWAVIALWGRWRVITAFIAGGVIGYAPVLYAFLSIYLIDPSHFVTPWWAQREYPVFGVENIQWLAHKTVEAFGSFSWANNSVGQFYPDFVSLRLIVICSLLTIGGLCAFGVIKSTRQERIFFVLAFVIVMAYGLGLLVVKGFHSHHFAPLYFLVFLMLSSAAGRRGGRISNTALALCLALALHNGVSLVRAQERLSITRGNDYQNESYSLPASLARNNVLGDHHPVFTSWGLAPTFLFLTNGSIPYSWGSGAEGRVEASKISELLKQHGKLALFIAHSGWYGRAEPRLGHISEETWKDVLAALPGRQTGEIVVTGTDKNDIDYKIIFLEMFELAPGRAPGP